MNKIAQRLRYVRLLRMVKGKLYLLKYGWKRKTK